MAYFKERMNLSGGASQIRVVSAGSSSPTRTLTLAQAQQMGLIASGGPASPSKSSSVAAAAAVRNIRLSPLKGSAATVARQQPVVVGGGGLPVAAALQQAAAVTGGGTQQVIRIPASSLQHVMSGGASAASAAAAAAGQLQQIQVGNKMQYMRVVQAGGGPGQAQQQVLHLRGATPILPSTAAPVSKARAKSTLSGVKISVPPGGLAKGANVTLAGNYKVYQNRVLLPQGETLVKQEVNTETSESVLCSSAERLINRII